MDGAGAARWFCTECVAGLDAPRCEAHAEDSVINLAFDAGRQMLADLEDGLRARFVHRFALRRAMYVAAGTLVLLLPCILILHWRTLAVFLASITGAVGYLLAVNRGQRSYQPRFATWVGDINALPDDDMWEEASRMRVTGGTGLSPDPKAGGQSAGLAESIIRAILGA